MSIKSNVYSLGGGGVAYEFEVDTAFMLQFLIRGAVPGIATSMIETIRFQSGTMGYRTDDLLLECSTAEGKSCKILVQVKHSLTISEKDQEFIDVIQRANEDFSNRKLFNPDTDKIYLVKPYLTLDEKKHLKVLCSWAKVKRSCDDFISEATRIKGKHKYLSIFRNALSSKGKTYSDLQLFNFFRCLDILEYDFGEESSNSKANFLTLIDYAKNSDCDMQPAAIWDQVFSFVSNANNKGGSFDRSNVPTSLSSFFKAGFYAGVQKKLLNLSRQSYEIVNNIKDDIGTITLQRWKHLEETFASLASQNLTIITGEPGSGKSVVAKHLLDIIKQSNSGYLIVFKADELSTNLRDYFLKFDIHLSLSEIFSFFPLHSEHFIYIDSLEKLSEIEGEAFRQLQGLIKQYPHIKIITSCREAELPLIRIKYLSDSPEEPIKVGLLSSEELDFLSSQLPSIKPILQNDRLKALLIVPKYLDFAYTAIKVSGNSFSESDEAEFIQQLWSIIIENRTSLNVQGLPLKRNKLFIDIAVSRAKSMVPFVAINNPDFDAVANLLKEGVIVKSPAIDAYAPAHDILEDWALIRYVNEIFFRQRDPKLFYEALGKEPAIRRGYRLWVLQALKSQEQDKIDFFISVIQSHSEMERFWQDELIIALLYSPYLLHFLNTYDNLLLKDGWALLVRFVHLMRTACREYGTIPYTEEKKFIPIGESWRHIIHFINLHLQQMPKQHYNLMLYLIRDWHYILFLDDSLNVVAGEAGSIVKHLVDNYFLRQERYYSRNKELLMCVQIMLVCTGGNSEAIGELIDKSAAEYERNQLDTDIKDYYELVIEVAVSGFYSSQVAKHLPDKLIKLLKTEWIYQKPELSPDEEPWYRMSRSGMESNPSFGLTSEYKREYSTASAFQTPVYWLLQYHPEKTLDFIVSLLNHASTTYFNSDYASSDEKTVVEVILPSQTLKLHGSLGLWCMFRGTGIATPYLLQSVLMALEKYLLELAAKGMEKRDLLHECIEKTFRESKTVALTAVISSIVQAYPRETGKWVAPLYSEKAFIALDIRRCKDDYDPLVLAGFEDEIFQKERIASNKLPHRLKYTGGLKTFVIDYCFNIREYNKEIFEMLDLLKKRIAKEDWIWRRMVYEMDIRNWKVTKTIRQENSVQYQVEPVHKGKLKQKAEVLQKEAEDYLSTQSKTSWLMKVKKGEEQPDFSKWSEIFNDYLSLKEFNTYNHTPGLLAQVGVLFFWEQLEENAKVWCYNATCSIMIRLVEKSLEHDFFSRDISVFDDDAVAETLPLFIQNDSIDQDELLLLIVQVLYANIEHNSIWFNKFLNAFSDIVWKKDPENALRIWLILLRFAELDKYNPLHKPPFQPTQEELDAYNTQVEELARSGFEKPLVVSMDKLSLESYSQWVLMKVVKLIPNQNTPEICIQFLKSLVKLFIADKEAGGKKGRKHYHHNDTEDLQFDYHLTNDLHDKIPQVILANASAIGKELFYWVMEQFYSPTVLQCENLDAKKDMIDFFRFILKSLIRITDNNLPENNKEKLNSTIGNFKIIWQAYMSLALSKGTILCGDLLFLGIDWKKEARHWKPLDEMKQFFTGLIKMFGHMYPEASVNLLAHIGDTNLLLDGLSNLWEGIKSQPDRPTLLTIPHMVQLINRVYNYHLDELITNTRFQEDYLDILNTLIAEGSSDAYWIREYLISFRKPAANHIVA